MELQYETKSVSYMRRILHRSYCKEVTQEFKLPDTLPDIGRILGAWGQVILRSKKWNSSDIELSGGTTMWVMYLPEESDIPQCIETWVPFQMEFDIPKSDVDGVINAACYICSADARSVSTRKMILRANVGVTLEAFVADNVQINCYEELPEDVQILRKSYPVRIPVEAGEKAFSIDEEVDFPSSCPVIDKIIRYDIRNEIIESKIMTDKIVFRGAAVLHITYMSTDDRIYTWDVELPFSQYNQLENDFEESAFSQILTAVTGLELEITAEGKIHIKSGVLCQYTVYDVKMLELLQDAYSVTQESDVVMQNFNIPTMLDMQNENLSLDLQKEIKASNIADVSCCYEIPSGSKSDDTATIEPNCLFQVLYYDDENMLQCITEKAEGSWQLPVANQEDIILTMCPSGNPNARVERNGVTMHCDVLLNAVICANEEMQTIASIDILDIKKNLADRPSMVLRQLRDDSLWDVSKKYGTTVDAILAANQSYDETDRNKMLIIPIP